MSNGLKKAIAMVMALGLLVTSFAACGKKEPIEETVTRGDAAIEAPETTTEETTTEPTTVESDVKLTTTAASETTETTVPTTAPPKNPGSALASGAALTVGMIQAFGFDYDAKENVFYTKIDSWQRNAGFIPHYDALAVFGNMNYKTVKMDFTASDAAGETLNWRMQLWKGQYGVFGGAEIGIYTQKPGESTEYYACADDDHMIYMMYDLYLNEKDFQKNSLYFHRGWQKHWWLTGFKPLGKESVNRDNMVMRARIRMLNEDMALQLEKGFRAAGFYPGDGKTMIDTYQRLGTDIFFVWQSIGDNNSGKEKK